MSATELEAALRTLVSDGPVEVRENGRWFASLSSLQWEVRGRGGAPLLHLWSGERNLTRRVVGVAERSGERLLLEVQRFGRGRPDRLEFVRVDLEGPSRRVALADFRARFEQILASQFPDERVESLSTGQDLEHSLSGCYVRGVTQRGSASWAALGASEEASASARENILTFGLLWLDRCRQSARRRTVRGLRLFLPEGASRTACHSLGALAASAPVEIYEIERARGIARRMDARDAGNLDTWLIPRREIEAVLERARSVLASVVQLSPQNILAEVIPGTRDVALRFRGVSFAQWTDGCLYFGLGDRREELTPATRAALERLVRDLEAHRHALARDTRHPLYRAQPERWLETLVREDVTRIDARLDPQFLYAQVPAVSAGDRGVLDLLGVTRAGRLAVIELKAGEHLHLPLQAADYWLRVRWHQQKEDFQRYGYFSGLELQAAPPLLFLVAPGLRFHPSTDVLLRFLSPEIEVLRVGLAENWRRRLRVVLRQ